MNIQRPERDLSIETLRSIATILVVLLHISSYYVNAGSGTLAFYVANVVDSFTRIAVPLFVLISGRFLLGRQESYSTFYKKRASKILIPLVVWSIIYSVFLLFAKRYFHLGYWDVESFILNFVKGVPFYHLWYLYMVIGLYSITPFINMVIPNLSNKALWTVALVLLAFGTVNTIYKSVFGNNTFFLLWFADYLGYFLLGYLLKDTKKLSNGLLLSVYILSSLITVVLTYFMFTKYDSLFFYAYLSPFVVVGSLCFYKLFCQISLRSNIFSRIAKYSFGIYLIHAGLLFALEKLGPSILENPFIGIPVKFVLVFLLSLFISYLISKTKYINKII